MRFLGVNKTDKAREMNIMRQVESVKDEEIWRKRNINIKIDMT